MLQCSAILACVKVLYAPDTDRWTEARHGLAWLGLLSELLEELATAMLDGSAARVSSTARELASASSQLADEGLAGVFVPRIHTKSNETCTDWGDE